MRDTPFNDRNPGTRRKRRTLAALAATALLAAACARATESAVVQDNGCATGAVALGNAFVRANPIYSVYFGQLEHYVASHRGQFARAGDAIRCARVLSDALTQGAIRSYDPKHLERQDALNAQLGMLGISPGPAQASASTQLMTMARTFEWLAKVLPAASGGDFGPMYTATTEEEQIGLFLRRLLAELLQDPMMRAVLQQSEPQIRELAELEYQMVVAWAGQLAR